MQWLKKLLTNMAERRASIIEWIKRTFETQDGRPDWKAITAFVSIIYIVQSGVAQQYWQKEPNMEIYNSFWWIVVIIAGLSTDMISIMSKIPLKLKKDEPQSSNRNTTTDNSISDSTSK